MNITEISTEKKEARTIRLAAYCRVSSASEDQLHSFAAQIRYYTDYAGKQAGCKLVDIYADEGLSGTDMKKRDELNRLIRDCKKGKVDRIITKSVSRFARNTQELLTMLRLLKELGVSVYFEEQGIDTDNMNAELIVTFPGMAAQQESEAISGNMRWSYRKRMEAGTFNCCTPAYGFDLVSGQLTVNEEEATIVRRIFDLYLQGYSYERIAKQLNEEKVPRKRAGEKWTRNGISYILNNERYMGDALLQKSFTTDTLPYKQVRNRGEKPQYYVENANPPIVSREIYAAAQMRQKTKNPACSEKQDRYPLAKIMRCPDCGRTFRRQITAQISYWMCSNRSTGSSDCQMRRVREDMVYDTFLTMLYKLHDNRADLIGTVIRQLELIQSRSSGAHEEIHELDKQLANLSAQNLVLARLHNNGILKAVEYTEQSDEISNKISALRARRRRILAEDTDEELLTELKELNGLLESHTLVEEFDKELFAQIVERIVVNDNANLTFKLLGGIELTEEICERGRCRSL